MTDPFRELFCAAQGRDVPVASFERIAHWIGPARGLVDGEHTYASAQVYVPAGFFYQLSTPPPDGDEVDRAMEEARANGAAYVMYPCVRTVADRSALVERGFQAFPWFVESSCARSGVLEVQMRRQLGSHRFKEIRRVTRRYDADYEAEFFIGREQTAPMLREFDRLHQKNLDKHGHRVNFYDSAVLERLLASSLGDRTFLFFSRDRQTGTRVQGLLGLLDHGEHRMQLLVAGIDHPVVRAGHNVYLAAIFALYAWGEAQGFALFDFGRGKQLDKVRLGANQFHLLVNYVRGVDRPLHDDLVTVQREAHRKIAADLLALAAKMQDDYVFPTSCA